MHRILLVDDQEANLLALGAVLAAPGRELVKATSGADAIAKSMDGTFAIAVLDVMMPGMDGLETAIALRQIHPELPIIFITAISDDAPVMSKVRALPRTQWLCKPIDATALLRAVESYTTARRD